MALRINGSEFYAIDSHSHLGRRKTPLGHGVASFLGDDLVRNLDEAGLDCAVAFPLGASYTDYSKAKGQKLSNSVNILFELFTGALQR